MNAPYLWSLLLLVAMWLHGSTVRRSESTLPAVYELFHTPPRLLQHVRLDTAALAAPHSSLRRQILNATVAVLSPPVPCSSSSPLRLIGVDVPTAAMLRLPIGTAGEWAPIMAGQQPVSDQVFWGHSYGGHQFGVWAGQLGDGRACSVGERHDSQGRLWEISVKGTGPTPFSRRGDGRAVLQSLVREAMCSIALEALGVPTTRVLAVLAADGDAILRDEFYQGHPSNMTPGLLVRVSPTFLRFGSFQLAAKRQGSRGLVELARYALTVLAEMEAVDDVSATPYLARAQAVPAAVKGRCFFAATHSCAANVKDLNDLAVLRCLLGRAVERLAALVAAWQSVGFVHGVMNTDNLSILGLTIDMNVFGFLDTLDPAFVANRIDEDGLYAFGRQPAAALWALHRLADAFAGQVFEADSEKDANTWMLGDQQWLNPQDAAATVRDHFHLVYPECLQVRLHTKLFGGLLATGADTDVRAFLKLVAASQVDYHLAFRALGNPKILEDTAWWARAARASKWSPALLAMAEALMQSLKFTLTQSSISLAEWQQGILNVNPAYVLRTAPSRQIARRVASNEFASHAALFDVATALLRAPFTPRAPIRAEMRVFDEKGLDSSQPVLAGDTAALADYVQQQFASPVAFDQRHMQSSCGGQ